jgi:DUF1680 family protein
MTGVPGQSLRLRRRWARGDRVVVEIGFPLTVLEGGESCPEHRALEYGAQVLAVDADVNGVDLAEYVFFDTGVRPTIRPYTGSMPAQWVGEQAFVSNAVKTRDGSELVLVPHADASQTGGDIRVWIRQRR